MLRELVWRDWILNRRTLLLSFAVFFAFQLYSILRMSSDRAWLVFAAIYASFLTIIPVVVEDTSQATASTCALPVTRTDVVRARFVASWVLTTAVLAVTAALPAVVPGSAVEPAIALQPGTLLAMATTVTAVVALMQPFTIRFGMLGVMIFLVSAQVLGGAALFLAARFRRPDGVGAGVGPIRAGLSELSAAVTAVHDAVGPAGFVVVVLAALAVVNWLGYRFAVFLFRRREL
jgi:hypothetical protein